MRIIDSNSMLALRNYLPEISKYASGNIGGPLSIGFPEPLKMRPSISSDTGVFRTCKEKQHIVTKQTRWQLLDIYTNKEKENDVTVKFQSGRSCTLHSSNVIQLSFLN